jgi:hypothetical protein
LRSGPPKPIARTGERKNTAFEWQRQGRQALRRSVIRDRRTARRAQDFLSYFQPLPRATGIAS